MFLYLKISNFFVGKNPWKFQVGTGCPVPSLIKRLASFPYFMITRRVILNALKVEGS